MISWGTIIQTIVTVFITALITGLIGYLKGKAKKPIEEYKALETKVDLMLDAQLCSTRKDLIHECNKYITKGEIPIYALDNINKMYTAYHNLGGNGTITELYNEVKELPLAR